MQILRDLQREILYVRIPKGLRVWAWVRPPVSREGYWAARAAARSLLSGNRQSSWRALQSMYTPNRRALGSPSSHFPWGERPHRSSTASTIGFGSLRHSGAQREENKRKKRKIRAAGWLWGCTPAGICQGSMIFLVSAGAGLASVNQRSGGMWIDCPLRPPTFGSG